MNPTWYKDAVVYQLHVRSFYDSNRDGIGDFKGLTERLEYLRDLGVTALWLLPFYPSPLKDDGYDIADYMAVNPCYGTLEDFRIFIAEAKRLRLRVITELVLNHTSDKHSWFRRARKAPKGSPERDFYVWNNTQERYQDARIIFKDFEVSNWTWDPIAEAYYWHRFYSHQPDLNFENPVVHDSLLAVVDFWFELGVDGLRLDAVPYLYERDGTICENLPETHEFLRKVRAHIDAKYADKMLLAEANQWPEDTVPYFGSGDECHMCFHFPLMPRLFMALETEDRFPVLDILGQTPEIPPACQWAIFLRNHDELTLEMVTEEERDYMWRIYAPDSRAKINLGIRRRLAALLGNNRREIELLNSLLFSLPGTPVVYYGDEIGMGDNIYLGDRNGVRTPLQWSSDKNAGFSQATPQQLYLPVITGYEFHYEAINIETQEANPNSLLWWMKRLIALRKRTPSLSRGAYKALHPDNPRILCFLRVLEDEVCLIAANMSRTIQYVNIEIPEYVGATPVELFGNNQFPPVNSSGLFLTFGPHQFYLLKLLGSRASAKSAFPLSNIRVTHNALRDQDFLDENDLQRAVIDYFCAQEWFGETRETISHAEIVSIAPMESESVQLSLWWVVAKVSFYRGLEKYLSCPLAGVCNEDKRREVMLNPHQLVGMLEYDDGRSGLLIDALPMPEFHSSFVALFSRKSPVGSTLPSIRYHDFRKVPLSTDTLVQEPSVLLKKTVERNSAHATIVYGNSLVVKIFRFVDEEKNPEVEVGEYILEMNGTCKTAPLCGYLTLNAANAPAFSLAAIQEYVPNKRNAYEYTADTLRRFFEATLALPLGPEAHVSNESGRVLQLLGPYGIEIGLLAKRVAELHCFLASSSENQSFSSQPFDEHYRRSLFQSLRQNIVKTNAALKKLREDHWDDEFSSLVHSLIRDESNFIYEIQKFLQNKSWGATRIRIHGDLSLEQILYTGKDFVICGFEGNPAESIGSRRLKRSPLVDVASVYLSLHRISATCIEAEHIRQQDKKRLEFWRTAWVACVFGEFWNAYQHEIKIANLLPEDNSSRQNLLAVCLYEEILNELLAGLKQGRCANYLVAALYHVQVAGFSKGELR